MPAPNLAHSNPTAKRLETVTDTNQISTYSFAYRTTWRIDLVFFVVAEILLFFLITIARIHFAVFSFSCRCSILRFCLTCLCGLTASMCDFVSFSISSLSQNRYATPSTGQSAIRIYINTFIRVLNISETVRILKKRSYARIEIQPSNDQVNLSPL